MASLGEQLRTARRTKSKSLEDVSNHTNISKQYLEALEADRYDTLPGQVYVKGFLSSYAKCVGLDPEAILEQYDRLMTFSDLTDAEAPDNTARRRRARRVIRKRVFMLLIIVSATILCLAGLLWLRST